MSRQLRIYFPGAWYHIMNRGINRQRIFFNDQCRKQFLEYLSETINTYGIEIHAYCLMDNHYHLIVHTPRANISSAIRYLNSSYARYVNILMKRDGPLFRGRFKSIVVSDDEYLIKLSRYIHLNPKEANIIKNISAYRWSSYRFYLIETSKPAWLTTGEIMKRFGIKDFKNKYKKYVEHCDKADLEDFYKDCQLPPVYSNDELRLSIDEYIKNHSLSPEISGTDRISLQPSFQEIIEMVASHFNIDPKNISCRSNSLLNEPRRITMYICRKFCGYSLSEIGKEMGNISYKTVSSSITLMQRNNTQLEIAREIIKKIKSNIGFR